MIQPSAYDILIAHLVKQGELAQADTLAMLVASERDSRRHVSTLDTQLQITSQDRDARRRRMEIAMLILDYEQNINIEALWTVATNGGEVCPVGSWERLTYLEQTNFSQPRTFGAPTELLHTQSRHTHLTPNGQPTDSPGPWGTQPDPTATPTLLSCTMCGTGEVFTASELASHQLNYHGQTW